MIAQSLKRCLNLLTQKRQLFTISSNFCVSKYKENSVHLFAYTYRTISKKSLCGDQFVFGIKGNDTLKFQLISELNFKSEVDALPFTKLPTRTLLHIHRVTKNDVKNGYCKNRLYYIADHLQCSPLVLSPKLTQRVFIYSLSFDWLEKSIKVLLEYNVPNDRILRDLWVLKYHHETIRERLQRVRNAGIYVLYPWMVRCSEDILQRFISLTTETREILRDVKSTQAYLAQRLNKTVEHVEEMCLKVPSLKTIRVTKVKSFLDFLIQEGFKVEDIANKPRILTASQKTVEQRLTKLRKLGHSNINLNILCRSRKDFKKYLDSFKSDFCEK